MSDSDEDAFGPGAPTQPTQDNSSQGNSSQDNSSQPTPSQNKNNKIWKLKNIGFKILGIYCTSIWNKLLNINLFFRICLNSSK